MSASAPVERARTPGLSKSRYLAGLQCEKRLWMQAHARELATPPDAAKQAILDAGTEVGLRAHALFPGGVLVDEDYRDHEAAVARTAALLADASVPAIFEAAFTHDGVRIRVDVLERLDGGRFGLREVKSSTKTKKEHHPDVAVQLFVLEGCGLEVPSVELIHVDKEYVLDGDEIDWVRFFARSDLTQEARDALPDVGARVAALHGVLARTDAPEVAPWRQCTRPHDCEFMAHCQRGLPEDWVLRLPDLREGKASALRDLGADRIQQIPADFDLTAVQARVRAALVAGERRVEAGLARALTDAGPPALYLDFEAIVSGFPLWPGTTPYQAIPFQWSLHRQDAAGSLHHAELLAEAGPDPRRALAEALLAAVEAHPELPVLVYSHYEKTTLRNLARALPDLAARLDAVRARLVDLLPIVRAHVYDAAFTGSFSIKRVAPALVPSFGYDGLDGIADGNAAQLAFASMATGRLTGAPAERARAALRTYCAHDTLALVHLHRALIDLARAPRRNP